MNTKNILLFVSGLVIGGAAGVFGSMKYFQNKYQKRYEEDHAALEEYYHRIDEYAREEHPIEENEVNPINIEGESRPGGRMSAEERAEVKAKLNRNWEGTTNYAGMYREKNGYTEEKLAEGEHPLDQGENGEEDPEDGIPSADEEAFDEHQKNKHKKPRIINEQTFSDLPAYISKQVLYFYAYDEVLVDEDDEDNQITDPESLIGDALTKYGFADNDERIIFVMNYGLDAAYEIQKVDASWSDSH